MCLLLFPEEELLIGFILKSDTHVYSQEAEHMASQKSFADLDPNPLKSEHQTWL